MVIALSEIMKDEFSNLEFDATDIFNESAMNIASFTYVVMRKRGEELQKK